MKKFLAITLTVLTFAAFAGCGKNDDVAVSGDSVTLPSTVASTTKEAATQATKASSSAPTISAPLSSSEGTVVSGIYCSLTIPSTWDKGTSSYSQVDIIIAEKQVSNGFNTNINVVVESTSLGADAYLAAAKNSLSNAGYTVGATGSCTINNTYCTTLEYTASANGILINGTQYYYATGSKVYVITYSGTTPVSQNAVAKSIIASFKPL
ncbi:MAG: hypothetical protein Q4F06_02675 [Eubacteriales bacterium]|nr:hypothetical protein [Eubacteriales bacterium]